MADDTMRDAVLEPILDDLRELFAWCSQTPGLDLATVEQRTRTEVLAVGARIMDAGLAARGTGKTGAHRPCGCGGQATFEGYRPKGVQTVVGWVRVRRAYYHCRGCGTGQAPLDACLGLARDSHSPGVRRLASQFGALLPFAQAAAALADAAGLQLSASTVRAVTEVVGCRREAQLTAMVQTAWRDGLPVASGPAPTRVYVAMDGVRIMSTSGEGKEAKVGVVVPEYAAARGQQRATASYAVSLAEASVFGPRLALEAHRRGLEAADEVVVLGDGAEWIWNLAAEHFPTATCIVDWYHASERVWELGRALHGEGEATARWVAAQLEHLARGEVRVMVAAWQQMTGNPALMTVRDEQITYFTNQAPRMAYDQYRARGLDIGSGMVESACKYVVGAREKGPGMRWSLPGAQAVANVRVLHCNHQWDDYDLAA